MTSSTRTSNSVDPNETPAQRQVRARHKIIDYLSRRDHSPLELKRKMKLAGFSPEEIQSAIEWSRELGYLRPLEEQSQNRAHSLHRKGKGIAQINSDLQKRGLPPITADEDAELEKAKSYLQKQLRRLSLKNPQHRQKLMRSLITRGFSGSVARKALQSVQSEMPESGSGCDFEALDLE